MRRRALAIFALLAEAEGAVHGMDPAEVTFHEVGAWDATVDIVAAAYLIEALGPARWSVGAIPLGSGRVRCAHGLLPVPARQWSIFCTGWPPTTTASRASG